MNKIYKLVWSKTRNMYIAVCEYARTHTKSPTAGGMNRAVAAGVLACVLSCGAVMPVYAAGSGSYEAGGASASGTNSVAIGTNASSSGVFSTALGPYAQAIGVTDVAIGFGANDVETNFGGSRINGLQFGGNYVLDADVSNVVAVGAGSLTTSARGVALGNDAIALAKDAVALGARSVAHNENEVSFGYDASDYDWNGNPYGTDLNRRLTHVADGTDDHDVSTVGQMHTYTTPADNGNYVAGFSAS